MKAFDELWDRIDRSDVVEHCSAVQPAQMAHRLCYVRDEKHICHDFVAKHPNPMCPHAASLLDSVSEESLDWLQYNFLWGNVSKYSLSVDGTIAFNEGNEVSSPLLKLELLIRTTHDRRATVCADAHVNVLSEDDLDLLLKAWKNDYWLWMHPSNIDESWNDTGNQWQQRCRKAFRTFIFHIIGNYEMVIFFLTAPFTSDNLDLFRRCWEQSSSNKEVLERSKRLVRES